MFVRYKQLNYILSNGLCVVNAKFKKNSSIITLFITNFSDTTKVLFDLETKTILSNKDNIDVPTKDIVGLTLALGKSAEKSA